MQRHTDQHLPCDKGSHTDRNGKGITDKTCSIEESHLYLKRLAADRAGFVHFHKCFEIIGIMILIKIAPATVRAFIGQNAFKQAGFGVGMNFSSTHSNVVLLFSPQR